MAPARSLRGLRLSRLPVLPTVLGLSDGILNALTLAAGAILRGHGDGVTTVLALRVGAASLVTAGFTMFVAYYSERRSHLLRSARQLNLTEPGRLAASNLGRQVVRESLAATAVAALASLIGAAAPLLVGVALPVPVPALTVVIAVGCLGLLGWVIGARLEGHRGRWCLAMVVGGALVTVVGAVLDIA